MRSLEEAFNRSGFSRFINSMAGRVFRVIVGIGFFIAGFIYRDQTIGIVLMIFSIAPLSAGIFDLCYVSALMGGPISGAKIRNKYLS